MARLAGAKPVGLRPLRRTAILINPGVDASSWPLIYTADDELYFKPDTQRLLVSPADETPTAPCNAAADDLDVAIAVDRLERATTLRVQHIEHRWAGLRSFVLPDRTPVVGPDPEVEGLVWLAAQGGYGIRIAPALARCACALAVGEELPADLWRWASGRTPSVPHGWVSTRRGQKAKVGPEDLLSGAGRPSDRRRWSRLADPSGRGPTEGCPQAWRPHGSRLP